MNNFYHDCQRLGPSVASLDVPCCDCRPGVRVYYVAVVVVGDVDVIINDRGGCPRSSSSVEPTESGFECERMLNADDIYDQILKGCCYYYYLLWF